MARLDGLIERADEVETVSGKDLRTLAGLRVLEADYSDTEEEL